MHQFLNFTLVCIRLMYILFCYMHGFPFWQLCSLNLLGNRVLCSFIFKPIAVIMAKSPVTFRGQNPEGHQRQLKCKKCKSVKSATNHWQLLMLEPFVNQVNAANLRLVSVCYVLQGLAYFHCGLQYLSLSLIIYALCWCCFFLIQLDGTK